MGSEECLDGNLHRAELFDGVLAPLEKGLQISESLRTALGWDKPLTVFTLAKQLEHVLKHDNAYGKVRIILKELGGRNLREDEMDFIRCRIADRAWVPVSGRKLAETPYAVFTDAMPSVGFYKITFNEDDEPGVCEFLSRMGCFTRYATTSSSLPLSN
jgi:sacsin